MRGRESARKRIMGGTRFMKSFQTPLPDASSRRRRHFVYYLFARTHSPTHQHAHTQAQIYAHK